MPHDKSCFARCEGTDRLVVIFTPGSRFDEGHDTLGEFRCLLFVLVRQLPDVIFPLPQLELAGHFVAAQFRLADEVVRHKRLGIPEAEAERRGMVEGAAA